MANKLTVGELRELCNALGNDVRFRRQEFIGDPGPARLHDLRIAVRAGRSLLVLTRDSYAGDALNTARHAGARLSYATGRARNLDVFAEHWRDLTLELDSDVVVNLAPVIGLINDIRQREYLSILELLRQDESTAFETELEALGLVEPNDLSADEVVVKAIRRINKRVVAVAGALSDLAPDEVLHQARKDLKKLRYSLEMTRSHFPTRTLDKFVETVSDLHTVIGRHQDAVVFSNELWGAGRKLGSTVSTDTLVSIGVLLAPIEDVRRRTRRRAVAKLRAYVSDDVQHQVHKLLSSID